MSCLCLNGIAPRSQVNEGNIFADIYDEVTSDVGTGTRSGFAGSTSFSVFMG